MHTYAWFGMTNRGRLDPGRASAHFGQTPSDRPADYENENLHEPGRGHSGAGAFGSSLIMVQKAWAGAAGVTWQCQPVYGRRAAEHPARPRQRAAPGERGRPRDLRRRPGTDPRLRGSAAGRFTAAHATHLTGDDIDTLGRARGLLLLRRRRDGIWPTASAPGQALAWRDAS
jgi:hypothetical protein